MWLSARRNLPRTGRIPTHEGTKSAIAKQIAASGHVMVSAECLRAKNQAFFCKSRELAIHADYNASLNLRTVAYLIIRAVAGAVIVRSAATIPTGTASRTSANKRHPPR